MSNRRQTFSKIIMQACGCRYAVHTLGRFYRRQRRYQLEIALWGTDALAIYVCVYENRNIRSFSITSLNGACVCVCVWGMRIKMKSCAASAREPRQLGKKERVNERYIVRIFHWLTRPRICKCTVYVVCVCFKVYPLYNQKILRETLDYAL